MRITYRSTILSTGILFCSLLATAQQPSISRKAVETAQEIPNIIVFDQNSTVNNARQSREPENIMGLPEGNDFLQTSIETDALGHTHTKYVQTFKGIPVAFGTASMNTKGSQLLSLSNEAYIINEGAVATTPTISKAKAIKAARGFYGATAYVEDNVAMAEAMDYQQTVVLEILPIYDEINSDELVTEFKLAYKVDIFAYEPTLKHSTVYVDATTSEILLNLDQIYHTGEYAHTSKESNAKGSIFTAKSAAALVAGTAATRYNGNRSIETTLSGGRYVLQDRTRGNGINTYNSGNTNRYPTTDFTDNDNNWTAAEFDNAAKDNGALDAHWGSEVTYDYWMETHGRDSFDNRGAAINSWVHFNQVSGSRNGYDNAFWNGRNMTYGDGNRFDILTALDVAAHEIGHAVCTNTADLAYRRESGALNEGFSDIWGAAVEYYALQKSGIPTGSVWQIGENLGNNLRSMSDPKSRNHPDTYLGTNWRPATRAQGCAVPSQPENDQCGVHSNSGVLNHWYYILTVGKSGTNDVGDQYNVSGIGIDKASEIAYRMESVYLTANATFADARTAGIQSARDLYGTGSNEEKATTNAWYAVNVGDEYTGGTPNPNPDPNPTADTEAPSKPGTLQASNVQDTSVQLTWGEATDNVGVVGYQIWLGNDRNLGTVTGLTETVTGLEQGTSYTFSIKAVDAAGNSSEFSNSVTVIGGQAANKCAGVPAYNRNQAYNIGDQVVFRDTLYERVSDGWINLGPCSGEAINSVGSKNGIVRSLGTSNTLTSVTFYPNPVTGNNLTVAIDGLTSTASYTLSNLVGQVVATGTIKDATTELNIGALTTGLYVIQVQVDSQNYTSRLVIE